MPLRDANVSHMSGCARAERRSKQPSGFAGQMRGSRWRRQHLNLQVAPKFLSLGSMKTVLASGNVIRLHFYRKETLAGTSAPETSQMA